MDGVFMLKIFGVDIKFIHKILSIKTDKKCDALTIKNLTNFINSKKEKKN